MDDSAAGVVWDLSAYFPAFDGPQMRAFKARLAEDVAALQQRTAALPPLAEGSADGWAEVVLAADLNVDGMRAWGRLYDTVTGKLEFTCRTPDGREERRPISAWRSLMSQPDRDAGRAAFEGGNRAWEGVADVCAAALNAIAGCRLTLTGIAGSPTFWTPPFSRPPSAFPIPSDFCWPNT